MQIYLNVWITLGTLSTDPLSIDLSAKQEKYYLVYNEWHNGIKHKIIGCDVVQASCVLVLITINLGDKSNQNRETSVGQTIQNGR